MESSLRIEKINLLQIVELADLDEDEFGPSIDTCQCVLIVLALILDSIPSFKQEMVFNENIFDLK